MKRSLRGVSLVLVGVLVLAIGYEMVYAPMKFWAFGMALVTLGTYYLVFEG